jgi:hypothetical protein
MSNPSVDKLAEHLATTGTGKAKLQLVRDSKTADDAVTRLAEAGHHGTVAKAKAYNDANRPQRRNGGQGQGAGTSKSQSEGAGKSQQQSTGGD